MKAATYDHIEKAVGTQQESDYILNPKSHAEKYKNSLPFLAELLIDSELQYYLDQYELYDKKAIKAQQIFNWWSFAARLAGFFTAVFSVLIILTETERFNLSGNKNLTIIFAVCIVLFSVLAATAITFIRNYNLLGKWMSARSEAEENRIIFFNELVHKSKKENVENQLTVLAYFQRYQLDIQLNYYQIRSKALSKKSNKLLLSITVMSIAIALINALFSIKGRVEFLSEIKFTHVALLVLVIQAFTSMITSKELNEQNARNSERYNRTYKALLRLKSKISSVRKAIIEGDKTVVYSYTMAVHEPMSAENRQWLSTMHNSSLAIVELEKSLKRSESSLE